MGPVGSDAHQIGLAGDRCTAQFHRLHGLQDLMAEGDEIHCREMVSDVAERTSHIMLGNTEFIRNIFCKFAYIELAVNHDNSDHGRGEEVGHIIIDGGKLSDLGLILGVDRVEFLVDRLQLFVGTLQLFIGRQQFLIGRLKLRVDGLELCDCMAEIVLRDMQILFQRRGKYIRVSHRSVRESYRRRRGRGFPGTP